MFYNIAAFSHIGTERDQNQDRILIQDAVYQDGFYSFDGTPHCFCFLADGIGGSPNGDLAAQFILELVNQRISHDCIPSPSQLGSALTEMNCDLLALGNTDAKYYGAGTTLVGLIITDSKFRIINAGDSLAYVFRKCLLIKITEDQVVNPFEQNSPLISYFGGKNNELTLDFNTVLRDVQVGDIFLLTSDGLFKTLESKQIKAILSNSKTLVEKAKFIRDKALRAGAEDNISCILIEVFTI